MGKTEEYVNCVKGHTKRKYGNICKRNVGNEPPGKEVGIRQWLGAGGEWRGGEGERIDERSRRRKMDLGETGN